MTLTSTAAPSAFPPDPHFETERPFNSRERFVSYDEVHNRTGLSRTTIWRLEKIKDFPKGVRISPGRRAWRESDLNKWIASRLEPAE
jgi:predicted DNA-binding transcriptional regulator AlpA